MTAKVTMTVRFVHLCISVFLYLCSFHLVRNSAFADHDSAYVPLENIVLNCGSLISQAPSYDGRNWSTDIGSQFVASNSDSNSTVSEASSPDTTVPEVPYMTSRFFFSKFTYTFNVTPGPKFIRLHFYPDSYMGLDASKAFVSVSVGHYTLLKNFSAHLNANYTDLSYFFKEFIVHVSSHSLDLTFSPSSSDYKAYAFVNGIEVVSMPLDLYIHGNSVPLTFVGFPHRVIELDNSSALETVYRLNVGGETISPDHDTGMFRTWTRDLSFLFGAAHSEQPYDLNVSIAYSSTVPAYTAPDSVYRTARSMSGYADINKNYNLSWFFPVDTGFTYLVRLHFCEVVREITKQNQRSFNIFINNQTAQEGADVIEWSHGYGVPVFRDYIVLISAFTVGKQDLWLELHPNTKSKPEYFDAILNGVEIFKVSDKKGNLAGLNPPQKGSSDQVQPSSASSKNTKKKILAIVGYSLGGLVVIILIICLLAFFLTTTEMWRKKKEKSKESLPCRHFSIREIKAATNGFDEAQLIGRGGFGLVYKGYIDGGNHTAVAIKRRNQASSEQGLCEFDAEINMLSDVRHQNIVSMIGYCKEDPEMVIVYEYMPNGTLFEHLHLTGQQQKPPLSWNQRLKICIGAARGLHYLHTGKKLPIIHRDVKTTNILLDTNFVGKISDFGLSKLGSPMKENSQHFSTNIKGSLGYLDPEYYRHYRLTEKSDVYSFGVVLLEVVSGRQPMNENNGDQIQNDVADIESESLVEWALSCLLEKDIDRVVDRHLKGEFVEASLATFLEIIQKCLAEEGVDRPSMSEVLCSLELALRLQVHGHDKSKNLDNNSDLLLGIEFSEIMVPMGR